MGTPSVSELDLALRLGVAALVGLAVGLEREWSGHTSGPDARFAGLRTFLLLGIIGGAAGLLQLAGFSGLATAIIAGAIALAVSAYLAAVRRPGADIDGTTETAAVAVVVLGCLAGVGWTALAAGAGSVVVLALSQKTRLHWLVGRVGETELLAALQFAVLALVVLPLLPDGPYLGPIQLRPRMLWSIVLFFCGLNFLGFLARRAFGARNGYAATGLLGGLLSSTGVTFDFSRVSRLEPGLGSALALGTIGACTVLVPRIIVVSSVLNPAVGWRLATLVWPPALIGAVIIAIGWKRRGDKPIPPETREPESPLRLTVALQMAVAFQIAITALAFVTDRWGTMGIYPSAVVLGLTDVDALTVSMSRSTQGIAPEVAATAIAIGVLANTMLKMTVAAIIGVSAFRRWAITGLAALAAASVVGLLVLR